MFNKNLLDGWQEGWMDISVRHSSWIVVSTQQVEVLFPVFAYCDAVHSLGEEGLGIMG